MLASNASRFFLLEYPTVIVVVVVRVLSMDEVTIEVLVSVSVIVSCPTR